MYARWTDANVMAQAASAESVNRIQKNGTGNQPTAVVLSLKRKCWAASEGLVRL